MKVWKQTLFMDDPNILLQCFQCLPVPDGLTKCALGKVPTGFVIRYMIVLVDKVNYYRGF